MTTAELLSSLRQKDVKVWLHGDRVRFNAPPGAITPELRSELSQRKPEILRFLKAAAGTSAEAEAEIERVSRDGRLPLSFSQQRLWFLNQLDPGLSTYNLSDVFQLSGKLNIGALCKALSEIVRRHEVLRTTFPNSDGQAYQKINDPAPVELKQIDLGHLSQSQQQDEFKQLGKEEARRPFDLTRDQMLRAALFRFAEDEYLLLLTMHHIASDGWSLAVLRDELSSLYNALAAGEAPGLPSLPIQYADYAFWQQQRLAGDALNEGMGYWKKKLGGRLPVLELPSDYPRPATQTYDGSSQSRQFPASLSDALKALSRKENATIFMALVAAFKALLYRYTGQEDMLLGTPVAGRDRTQTEPLIGFFVNTLVLRTDLSGDPTFRQMLGRVRETCVGAFAHQDTPFEKLAAELQPERSQNHTPLFQVAFAMEAASQQQLTMSGVQARPLFFDDGNAKFDLSLYVDDTPKGFKTIVEYRTDLFSAETIERLLGHLETLLQSAVKNPDERISALQMLTAPEKQQLLFEWNNTATSYQSQKSLQELFQEETKRSSEHVAIVSEKQSLTYRELNARSNQLARFLQAHGVKTEECIGLCMDRSPELIVALMAILKAGGAYVPLDPSYPPERLEYILNDARIRIVVGQRKLLTNFPLEKITVVDPEGEPRIAGESSEDLPCESKPEHLAYVMYTSGSTGQPKGVTIPHRGIVRLVKNTNFANFGPDEVFLLSAPVTFDASTLEIWGPLLNGGRLAVPQPGLLSLRDLGDAIVRYKVTTLWLTAGLFHLMVDTRISDIKNLRQLLAGGDILSVPHVKRMLESAPSCRLINGYGPTENTTFTCCHTVTATDNLSVSVPIGRPISNTRIYILDSSLQPVPIGVPGELYIGGDGLAKGYLNQPELTKQKFVPISMPEIPDRRLYKTGDRVRYLSNGSVEFLGRIDFQVKIRGFRIEPEEIAAVLNQHPGVRDSVVVVLQKDNDKSLAAYFIPNANTAVSNEELRRFLTAKLPAWMIPSTFTKMDSFPLNANGKVDRRALPEPTAPQTKTTKEPLVLISPLESELVDIWEELLNKRPVGIKDSFFDLGGHSLLAVRMIAQVESVFKKKIPLSTLFSAPTIEKLAQAILEQTGGGFEAPIIEVQRGTRRPFFFLHGDLLGGGLYCWNLARYLHPDQSFYGIPPQGLEGQELLPGIEAMAEYHLKSIRSIQPHGPYVLGGTCNGAMIAFEIAQRLRRAGEQVSALVLVDASARNARYRRLHQIVQFVARLRGLEPHARLLFFRRWRSRAINLSDFLALPLREQINQCIPRLQDSLKRRATVRPPVTIGTLARNGPPTVEARHLALNKYLRLLESYVPQPYPGLVYMLLSSKHFEDGPDDRQFWWRKIVKNLQLHYIPGEHATFTSKNLPYLARYVSEALDA
jgi:aspartate racemase